MTRLPPSAKSCPSPGTSVFSVKEGVGGGRVAVGITGDRGAAKPGEGPRHLSVKERTSSLCLRLPGNLASLWERAVTPSLGMELAAGVVPDP